jgi:type 1 glutamine amidotransferase
MNMRFKTLLVLLTLAATTFAAPIRVGIFTGIGQGRFWTTSAHTAANAITLLLAAPDTARLGPNLIKPRDGVTASRFGIVTGTGYATVEQKQAFINALDTLNVLVFVNNTAIGEVFSEPDHRQKIEAFVRRKGLVSVHKTIDSYGAWPAWDSLHGARFQNHPSSDRNAAIRLDTLSGRDEAWHFLNRGLADTTFLEEWFSYTTNADVIRSTPGLKTTVNVDETTYAGGLGGARSMGTDHPLSWYRELSEGGRFFYTAIGHRANLYQGGNQPRFLRRQLYNAILWAAGVDSTGNVVSVTDRTTKPHSRVADQAQLSFTKSALTVTLLNNGAHSIEILALNGRRIDARQNAARGQYTFDRLTPGVHIITVFSHAGRTTKLITIP